MAQWVTAHAAKSGDLTLMPWIYRMKGQTQHLVL